VVLAIAALVNWISGYFQEVLIERIAQPVINDIRNAMFRHIQRVGLAFTDRTAIGRVMSRMFGDVGALQEMMETTVNALGDLVTLFGIVIVLLVLDWRLALMALAVVPLLFLLRLIWQPFARRAFLRIRKQSSITNAYLDQNVSGTRVIQSVNRQAHNYGQYKGRVDTLYKLNADGARLGAYLTPTVDLLTGSALAVVIIAGGNFVLDRSIEIGTIVAFFLYVQRFFEPIRTLTAQYTVLQRAMAAGHRIFEVIDLSIEVKDKADAIELKNDMVDGAVEFQDVTFGYDPARPVLRNIRFRAEPGQTVAIVGPTGSGKTSIMSLAHRFYDVQQGRVLLGGYDVREVKQESLGRVMGMVLQEPFLFSASVFENIKYNTENATRDGVIRACLDVGAHDFILKLPHGYDTVLEQRGMNLSVGQRQLISFARALVADPRILILDEATANIDSYTELVIQKALARLLQGRTALVIAHRLSTIRNAHKIVVINRGEIVEEGTHDALVERDGLYAQLWKLNYASFDDLAADATRRMPSQGLIPTAT
ncbi:MAG: ABC transporter ATP-binding protein, partial [Chloroflexi bacterium]|nr:ABC transporter ATP-binding protein [Chloroflexota bacterium]